MANNLLAKTDNQLFFWLFTKSAHHNLKGVAKLVSKTADGPLYVAIVVALLVAEDAHTLDNLLLQLALVTYAVERPLYFLLKQFFKRNRPFHVDSRILPAVWPSDKFSFPSGHTSAAFVFAVLVAHVYPAIATVVYAWAACVGLSRVMLGVHYPGDVVAGAGLGMIAAFTAISMVTI